MSSVTAIAVSRKKYVDRLIPAAVSRGFHGIPSFPVLSDVLCREHTIQKYKQQNKSLFFSCPGVKAQQQNLGKKMQNVRSHCYLLLLLQKIL